jgi:hypothetical protein
MPEGSNTEWRGSPLDLDPYGIKEIVVEYDNGD